MVKIDLDGRPWTTVTDPFRLRTNLAPTMFLMFHQTYRLVYHDCHLTTWIEIRALPLNILRNDQPRIAEFFCMISILKTCGMRSQRPQRPLENLVAERRMEFPVLLGLLQSRSSSRQKRFLIDCFTAVLSSRTPGHCCKWFRSNVNG